MSERLVAALVTKGMLYHDAMMLASDLPALASTVTAWPEEVKRDVLRTLAFEQHQRCITAHHESIRAGAAVWEGVLMATPPSLLAPTDAEDGDGKD